jgi:signal transduction histidine kinase
LTIALTGAAVVAALYLVMARELGVTTWATGSESCTGPDCPPGSTDTSVIHGQGIEVTASTGSDVLLRTLPWTVGIILVLAGLSAALGWWLSGRLLMRVKDITEAARQVSERDLSARLDLPGPKDEIAELADTFDAMLARLETAMAAQRRFVANASHELRTPLASTRLALEAPLEQGLLDDTGRLAAQRALGSVKQASTTLDALLALATAEHDSGLPLDTLDLALVTRSAVDDELLGADLGTRRVDSHLESAMTLGDPVLVSRAVHNLVRNALVHSPDGSVITISSHTTDEQAVLEISNGGEVFDESAVSQLVEPFHRGNDSRLGGRSGSGLGLSIVQAVSDRFDGDLRLTPRPGGGMVARLAFPALGE